MKFSANHIFWLLVIFLAGSIAGCGIRNGPEPNTTLARMSTQEKCTGQDLNSINDKLFAAVKATPSAKDYVLGEGDLLDVSVFEASDLKTEGRVSERGFISLSLLGPVKVSGLTTSEAEQKIEDLYGAKYVRSPHVTVFVKQMVAGKITLMGEFQKTGVFPYLARLNLFQAMALGEGLGKEAGKMVQVRREMTGGKGQTFIVDLDELAKGGGDQLNIQVKNGDVIYVPKAGTVYVDGAVRKPGNYPITTQMNIPQAIIAAGGFAPYAEESKIKLIRTKPGGQPEIAQLSFKDLQKIQVGQNLKVKDRDVIFVETNKVEAMVYGITISGLGGVVGAGYHPPNAN